MRSGADLRNTGADDNFSLFIDLGDNRSWTCAGRTLYQCHAAPDSRFLRLRPPDSGSGALDRFDRGHRLVNAPQWTLVSIAQGVQPAEYKRVHAQPARDRVGVRFYGESELRLPWTPHVPARNLIRINANASDAYMRDPIAARRARGAAQRHARAQAGVGAVVEDNLHFPRHQATGLVDAALHTNGRAVTMNAGEEFFSLAHCHLHWPTCSAGEKIRQQLIDDVALAPEIAAHADRQKHNLIVRQTYLFREPLLHIKWLFDAGPHPHAT